MRPKKIKVAPRKTPQQARSAQTVQVILTAATRVLSKESLTGFNTNRVAQVAGVSIGSLYQYFPNKDALVTALIQYDHAQLVNQFVLLGQRLFDADAPTTVRAMATLVVDQQFSNPVLAAALDHEEARLPMTAELEQLHQKLATQVESILRPHFAHITATQVSDCMAIAQALIDGQAHISKKAPADLVDRVYRAVWGYLNHSHSSS